MNFGEMYLEITVVVKSVDHCPADPGNGFPESTTIAEELEFLDDGELITDKPTIDALEEYVRGKYGDKLDELAAEAYNDEQRDIEEAKADYLYQQMKEDRLCR